MDVYQFAIDMELDGERYYREQALKYAGTALQPVLELLAQDEAKHAALLTDQLAGKPYALAAQPELTRRMSLFRNAPDADATVNGLPDQPELYRAALAKEQQSVELYAGMRDRAADAQAETLFSFLVEEENGHLAILEEMYHHVNRPREWVESAEFGVREPY